MSTQTHESWVVAYVALGANLGDRRATLHGAIEQIRQLSGVRGVRISSLHETEALGGPAGQPKYLNAVARFETQLSPHDLLDQLLAIEGRFGRVREVRNAARTLDLDLLLYDDLRIDEPRLTLPHPRMWERAFVMNPLAELTDVEILRRRWHEPRPAD